jgi:ATP-dependent Clp protease protease subunit
LVGAAVPLLSADCLGQVTWDEPGSKHTGQPLARVEQDSLRDRWFSAAEARGYGMIDHIVEQVDDVRPAVASQMARA